jgi:uncharacterized RDD family membrane protein YckC
MNDASIDLASRGKRLGGVLIDGLILMVILVPVILATGVLQQAFAGRQVTIGQQVTYGLLGTVVFLLLNGYLLATRGKTIGKVAVGTRIVDLQGQLPPLGKLLVLRYFIPWMAGTIPIVGGLFSLIDALFIFGRERRCIHDHLAGTRVVNG